MSIDQSALGQVISEQMTAIEKDFDDGAIGAVISIVQVVPKEGEPEVRLRLNVPPALGRQFVKAAADTLEGGSEEE